MTIAEKLTPQQAVAVTNRGGKLLVSAAAGSGKTKVLVDRLLSYLTDPIDPADIDDFLIITYTKAAASELRAKIAVKLSERISQEPTNKHLQRQIQRLYLAKISTVHSFCADLLREFSYRLDIAPDFRVGDENECRELRESAMARTLDNAYKNIDSDEDFRIFIDTQGLGRDDRLVPQIVEKVYNSAQCHLDGEQWLQICQQNGNMSTLTDAGQTVWGTYLINDLKEYLNLQIETMQRCVHASGEVPEFGNVTALLSDTVAQLKKLSDFNSWDEISAHREIDFGRLTFPRKHDAQELADRIKVVRNQCKAGVEKKLRSFIDPTAQIATDLIQTGAGMRGLLRLVHQFSDEYDRLKRRRRILDFGDLEHRTLDLLLDSGRRNPTKIAQEIGQRFREVLVDEYQDSNEVQDAIFSALTAQRQNCFMVGDVKQSIYQFRLADPGIFLDKYNHYLPAEAAETGQGRKVMLCHNFRSGGAVLSAVNEVFAQCMSPKVGGLHYGNDEALHEGIAHQALGETEVELHAIDVREDTYAEEATFVAERIAELLGGSHMVRNGDELRPIKAEDIVILLRSPGSVGHHYIQALAQKGISCSTGGGQDLLRAPEIMTLRSFLQTISNPRQDIPLLAVLTSPVFGFTANDLAAIRIGKRDTSVFDALLQSADEKCVQFSDFLTLLRTEASTITLAQLLERIFVLTHLDSIYSAMQDGDRRSENLRNFFQIAVDFENAGRRDLGQFLEYLDLMEEKGLIASAEQKDAGAVTIMSIHKSKGLEFPVVFLCGLSRRFNQEDLRAQVLCDKTLGLGLSVMDRENRVRYPTIARRAIAAKTVAESISEELRVLYVAMTRARDRLIMTYADQHLNSTLSDIALRLDFCAAELITSEISCPGEWILQTALRRAEAGALFAISERPSQLQVSDTPWLIQVNTVDAILNEVTPEAVKMRSAVASDLLDRVAKSLNFQYPHTSATLMPSKMTATQLKGRQKDDEAAENTTLSRQRMRTWRRPSFLATEHRGKDYGNAIHKALQYISYDACIDTDSVSAEVDRLVQNRFLTAEQAVSVDCGKIARFFATELGCKLRSGAEVLREFKFSILEDAGRYEDDLAGEQILLQGVVDCALVEPDGITVIDFKTDYVTPDTVGLIIDRYRSQIDTYADALERIFNSNVKARYLYLFHLEQFVPV